MILSRLLDSFANNFGKWSCIYPALDAAAAVAALELVVGTAAGSLPLTNVIGTLGSPLTCDDASSMCG